MQKKSCPNFNHRRSNAPVRFCPMCGGVVNDKIPTQVCEDLDDQFARAEQLIKEGRAFFKSDNLEQLKSIPLPEKSARLTRSIRWDDDKSKAKRK